MSRRLRLLVLFDIALVELDGHLAHRPPLESALGLDAAIELVRDFNRSLHRDSKPDCRVLVKPAASFRLGRTDSV